MKIEMTKQEFKTLLELIYSGSWLINSHRDDVITKYEEFEMKIFSLAKEHGLAHFSDEEGYPTLVFDESMRDFIEEYDEDTFWVELVDRLAKRDLQRKFGQKELAQMSPDERFGELCKYVEKYETIFEKHGLDAVTLLSTIA